MLEGHGSARKTKRRRLRSGNLRGCGQIYIQEHAVTRDEFIAVDWLERVTDARVRVDISSCVLGIRRIRSQKDRSLCQFHLDFPRCLANPLRLR
jgi:hypothetical protein